METVVYNEACDVDYEDEDEDEEYSAFPDIEGILIPDDIGSTNSQADQTDMFEHNQMRFQLLFGQQAEWTEART